MIRRIIAAGSAAVALAIGVAVTPAVAADAPPAADLGVLTFDAPDVVLHQGGEPFTQQIDVIFDAPLPAGADAGVYLWSPQDTDMPFDALELKRGADGAYHATEPMFQEDPTGTWIAEVVVYDSSADDAAVLVDVARAYQVKEETLLSLNASPEPVGVGDKIHVDVALWCVSPKANGSLVACSGRTVKVYFDPVGASPKKLVGTYVTGKDGEVVPSFTAQTTGVWSATFAGTAAEWPAASNGDRVEVVKKLTRLSVNASPEPAAVGETLTVSGKLTRATSASAKTAYVVYAGKTVDVYFDPAGAAPRAKVATVTTDSNGKFAKKFTAKTTGTWSAQFAGTSSYAAVRSNGDNVVVSKKKTHLTVNASPEPVKKGGTVTVAGKLTHATSVRGTLHYTAYKGKTVTVWFDPTGPKGATKVATVTTRADGTFSVKRTQSVPGVWRAKFAGTANYAAATSIGDYVAVK
jgi:hypothetical protein